MANCMNCKNSNKATGILICTRTGNPVAINEWCTFYEYPFSKETFKTERLEPIRYGFSECKNET